MQVAVIGRPELCEDPRLEPNDGRNRHVELIDSAITDWIRQHSRGFVIAQLDEAQVPVG